MNKISASKNIRGSHFCRTLYICYARRYTW